MFVKKSMRMKDRVIGEGLQKIDHYIQSFSKKADRFKKYLPIITN